MVAEIGVTMPSKPDLRDFAFATQRDPPHVPGQQRENYTMATTIHNHRHAFPLLSSQVLNFILSVAFSINSFSL